MFRSILAALSFACLAAPALGQTPDRAPDHVLVVGQRPGPGLWKVSKGEHVLWVFGAYAPLPRDLTWRAHEVEAIVARSQEYIEAPGATAQVGVLRGLTLLPFAIGIKKNPDGKQLRDVLPADVYARWAVLKQKYIGDDDGIERERPLFAADTLYEKGLARAGLAGGPDVRKQLRDLVKKSGLKITSPELQLELDDPVKMLKEFKKSPMDDVACFSTTLDRLETDLDAMRVRANAWSRGDIGAMQKLGYADREGACKDALLGSAFLQDRPALRSMEVRANALWLAAAEKALETNASSLAVLPMRDILRPDGLIAALAAKGYRVEQPD